MELTTLRELIARLQQIEDQDQQVVSLVITADDLIVSDFDEPEEAMTPAQFEAAAGKVQIRVEDILDEARERAVSEIYDAHDNA
jgi:hypothetical protein